MLLKDTSDFSGSDGLEPAVPGTCSGRKCWSPGTRWTRCREEAARPLALGLTSCPSGRLHAARHPSHGTPTSPVRPLQAALGEVALGKPTCRGDLVRGPQSLSRHGSSTAFGAAFRVSGVEVAALSISPTWSEMSMPGVAPQLHHSWAVWL